MRTAITEQYLHGSFQRLLDVKTLACDCRVEFSLKRQQVHISLRFRNEISDLVIKIAQSNFSYQQ